MFNFKTSLAALLMVVGLLLTPISSFAAADGPMVEGQVTEVRPGGELTIKHGPIPNLDMAAMTMVFKLKDATMGKGLKKGDKIKFHAEEVDGKLTVMRLEK
jgi:Cu/Ag efflux protein CusF